MKFIDAFINTLLLMALFLVFGATAVLLFHAIGWGLLLLAAAGAGIIGIIVLLSR